MTCELIYVSNSCGDTKEKQKPEFEVVQEFVVNDTSEAASFVNKYNDEHNDHTYYWRRKKDRIGIWHPDGVCSYRNNIGYDFWDDSDEFFVNWISKLRKKNKELMKDVSVPVNVFEIKHKNIIKKIARIRWFWGKKFIRFIVGSLIYLKDEAEYYLWYKWERIITDISFNRRNVKSFKKTGHAISEPWSLSEHLLDDLKYNLKKLIDEKHGVSFQFIEEVVQDEHSNEPGFDFNKWLEKNYEITDEILYEKAHVRCNEVFQHIIDLIDKYAFYAMSGPEPIKEYPNMILEGSYDELDYEKMSEISEQCWNEIWDLVKKYSRSMYD